MRRRWIVLIALAIFFAFVLADSVGIFDDKPYSVIAHGDHSHYVPKGCDPPVPVGDAPTRAPAAGERIDCSGQIVPDIAEGER